MFQGRDQHDAQEFLRFFLDSLHEDLNLVVAPVAYTEIADPLSDETLPATARRWKAHYDERNKSFIKSLFSGQLYSRVKCNVCERVSVAFDPFWDISVPVPGPEATYTLEDCLGAFTAEETLQGENAAYCSQCKEFQSSTKQIRIQRLPPIIAVHIKRINHNPGYRSTKISTPVQYKIDRMDFTPFCAAVGEGVKDIAAVTGPTKPEAAMNTTAGQAGKRHSNVKSPVLTRNIDGLSLSSVSVDKSTRTPSYRLVGVVNHFGSADGGHYTASVRNRTTANWHDFDDANVSEIGEQELSTTAAYLLFYQRMDD
jgi:ubiquitin C-terminal hydrolase